MLTYAQYAKLLEEAQAGFVSASARRRTLTWPAVSYAALYADTPTGAGKLPKLPGLSRELAAAFQAKPRKCWRNAFIALLYSEGLGAFYVEGWAVPQDTPRPVAHGWLELAGKVIDLTWPEVILTTAYFPGLRYSLPDALDLYGDSWAEGASRVVLPFVARYRQNGLDRPAYYHAFAEARAWANENGTPRAEEHPGRAGNCIERIA